MANNPSVKIKIEVEAEQVKKLNDISFPKLQKDLEQLQKTFSTFRLPSSMEGKFLSDAFNKHKEIIIKGTKEIFAELAKVDEKLLKLRNFGSPNQRQTSLWGWTPGETAGKRANALNYGVFKDQFSAEVKQAEALAKEINMIRKAYEEDYTRTRRKEAEQRKKIAKEEADAEKKAEAERRKAHVERERLIDNAISRFAGQRPTGIVGTGMGILGGAAAGITALAGYGFLTKIKDTMMSLVAFGTQYNRTLEDTKLGIAAILTSMTTIKDLQGKTLEGAEKFKMALLVAKGVQKELQAIAMQTPATYQELVETYTTLLAPALSGKIPFQELPRLTGILTNAVKAMGLQRNQIITESRELLSGAVRPQTSIVATALGFTQDEIKKLRASGKFLEEIEKRMVGFVFATKEFDKTFSGAMSNAKDSLQRALGEGFKDAFEISKNFIMGFVDEMVVKVRDAKGSYTEIFIRPEVMDFLKKLNEWAIFAAKNVLAVGFAVTGLLMTFYNIAEGSGLTTIVKLVSEIVKGFSWFTFVILPTMGDMMGNIGKVIGAVLSPLSSFSKMIMGIFTLDYGMIKEGIGDLRGAATEQLDALKNLFDFRKYSVDMFNRSDLFEKTFSKFTVSPEEGLPAWIKEIMANIQANTKKEPLGLKFTQQQAEQLKLIAEEELLTEEKLAYDILHVQKKLKEGVIKTEEEANKEIEKLRVMQQKDYEQFYKDRLAVIKSFTPKMVAEEKDVEKHAEIRASQRKHETEALMHLDAKRKQERVRFLQEEIKLIEHKTKLELDKNDLVFKEKIAQQQTLIDQKKLEFDKGGISQQELDLTIALAENEKKRLSILRDQKALSIKGAGEGEREKRSEAIAEAEKELKLLQDKIKLQQELMTLEGGLAIGWKRALKSFENFGQDMVAVGESIAKSLQQGFSDFFFDVMQGKMKDLGDYIRGALAMIERAVANMLANQMMGSLFGSIGGGYTDVSGNTFSASEANYIRTGTGAPFKHSGGLIMHSGGYVPKFHWGGLNSDERPAILQSGEYVVSRKGVAALDRINSGNIGGDSAPVVIQQYNISAMDVKSFHDYVQKNKSAVINVIAKDMAKNGDTIKNARGNF